MPARHVRDDSTRRKGLRNNPSFGRVAPATATPHPKLDRKNILRPRSANDVLVHIPEPTCARRFACRTSASRQQGGEKRPLAMDACLPLSFAVNRQTHIDSVEYRREQEAVAFAELRAVLARYGLLEKYGITLLHKHFELADDEILVEYTDMETWTLTAKPTKVGKFPKNELVETTWALGLDETAMSCVTSCRYYAGSNTHAVEHRKSG
jgi:hypothetical protein